LPGLTANIRVNVQEHKNVLKVPVNSLHFNPPEEYIKSITYVADSVKEKWMRQATMKLNSSSDTATHSGIIWIKKENGLFPAPVTAGISDATFTEVNGNIQEGDLVVTGIRYDENETANTQQNPFMPKMPQRKRN